nr:MAG TPA: hypothetical protein [Caudoviricetes sp.]
MSCRRFVMNRRLFSFLELPLRRHLSCCCD